MGGLLVPVSTTVINRVEGTLALFSPLAVCCGWSAEVITSAAKRSIGFHNHGEGPYEGLLLVESVPISRLPTYCGVNASLA